MDKKREEAIEKVHQGLYLVLGEIDRICTKYDIPYYLEGGSMLGAVRHKAIIPWDDDADISMFRSDYERFRAVVRDELRPGFAFTEPGDWGEHFYDFIPHVIWLDSKMRADTPEEQYNGEGILNHMIADIFIVEDCADSDLRHKWTLMKLTLLYGLTMGHRYRVDYSEYKGVSGLAVRVLSKIGKRIPLKKLLAAHEKAGGSETGKNKERDRFYYSNYLFEDLHVILPGERIRKKIRVPFGELELLIPEKYDEWLTAYFGDYMQFPPEDKRVQLHMDEPENVYLTLPEN
ncbi:MAG: LicD family protein [Lachnospiraceae bacterium]|nr:LicD family protein [Lachnospiraceae bacterium]